MTWQINILWMIAVLVLTFSNLNQVLPPSPSSRDFWLIFLPMAAFACPIQCERRKMFPWEKPCRSRRWVSRRILIWTSCD